MWKLPRKKTKAKGDKMTREEVKTIIPGITDEQLDGIFRLHGESVTKAKGKSGEYENQIEKLKATLEENQKTISDLKEVADNSEQLKAKLAEYEKQESERKLLQEQEAKEKTLSERFEKIAGNKEFINELTKSGIYNEFKKSLDLEENKGKGDAEIFEAMVKDQPNIFANPNQPKDIAGVNKISIKEETAPKTIPEFF